VPNLKQHSAGPRPKPPLICDSEIPKIAEGPGLAFAAFKNVNVAIVEPDGSVIANLFAAPQERGSRLL